MNEPSPGYIGVKNMDKLYSNLKRGCSPTPVQAMCAGAGYAVKVRNLNKFGLHSGTYVLNPTRRSAWKHGYSCPWMKQGVWQPAAHLSSPSAKKGASDQGPGKEPPYELLKPEFFENKNFG